MYRIPNNVLVFSQGKTEVYEKFADYYNQYQAIHGNADASIDFAETVEDLDGVVRKLSFDERESRMNASLKREILRIAGVSHIEEFPIQTWATHPSISWATFAVVSAMIDMVLPQSVINSIGLYSEIRSIGWGDSATFDIKARDLFSVSKGGRSKRLSELRKQYVGQVAILPEPRQISAYVSLPKVLAGKESLAEFVMKMIKSIEVQLTYDVYDAFVAAMDAVDATASTGLYVTGYSQSEFLRLSQTVSAWNGGAKPIAIGTQSALANVVPANANYRYDIDASFTSVGYMTNFLGTSIMALPQVADWTDPFALKITDDRIWFLCPSLQKIVKVVLEGNTLAFAQAPENTANLTQTTTLHKSWGTGIAVSSVAGVMTV